MASTTLAKLDELLASLRADADEDAFPKWWELVEWITSDIEQDPRATSGDKELVERLRSGVSELMGDIREKVPNPYVSKGRLAASSLRSSVAKRTTQEDGWPAA